MSSSFVSFHMGFACEIFHCSLPVLLSFSSLFICLLSIFLVLSPQMSFLTRRHCATSAASVLCLILFRSHQEFINHFIAIFFLFVCLTLLLTYKSRRLLPSLKQFSILFSSLSITESCKNSPPPKQNLMYFQQLTEYSENSSFMLILKCFNIFSASKIFSKFVHSLSAWLAIKFYVYVNATNMKPI